MSIKPLGEENDPEEKRGAFQINPKKTPTPPSL